MIREPEHETVRCVPAGQRVGAVLAAQPVGGRVADDGVGLVGAAYMLDIDQGVGVPEPVLRRPDLDGSVPDDDGLCCQIDDDAQPAAEFRVAQIIGLIAVAACTVQGVRAAEPLKPVVGLIARDGIGEAGAAHPLDAGIIVGAAPGIEEGTRSTGSQCEGDAAGAVPFLVADRVVVGAAVDDVVSAAAAQDIGSGATEQVVVTIEPGKGVVAAFAPQAVGCAVAEQRNRSDRCRAHPRCSPVCRCRQDRPALDRPRTRRHRR